MSRSLSSLTRQAIYAAETDAAFLILLTLDHTSLSTPIRVTSDSVDTTSNGDVFVAFPFDISLPDDDDSRAPRAKLAIDNIDRQIVQAVRSLTSSASVKIEIVRAGDPDTVEAVFADFKLTNVTYDASVVEGDLTVEDFTTEPFPAATFSPSLFPGLF